MSLVMDQIRNMKVRCQQGFSLVEVLVAVLVIAIGLLGMAGMQSIGVNSNHISHLRSAASVHSENMAEMMRTNIVGVEDNDYAQNAAPATVDYTTITDSKLAVDCRTKPCTPAQLAQADAYNWLTSIKRDLPAAAGVPPGSVTCIDNDVLGDIDPCSPGSAFTITVSWQEKDVEAANEFVTQSFSTVFRP